MIHNVPLFGQKYPMSCWAASIRMILASKGRAVASDDDIAAPTFSQASLVSGLMPDDSRPLRHWGFTTEPAQTYSEDGIKALVQRHGPLWIACDVRTPGYSRAFPHIRVIKGVRDLQTPFALVYNDPWPVGFGAMYDETYAETVRKNELLGAGELVYDGPIYVAYLRN
jgi:hypothetical protein